MRQVTVAYSNKDFLKLLELQLAVEQIDPGKINDITADRLKHYNQVLSDQLQELQEELAVKEDGLRTLLHVDPFEPLSPQRTLGILEEDIRAVQENIADIQQELQHFQEVKQLKAWLKNYRPEPRGRA